MELEKRQPEKKLSEENTNTSRRSFIKNTTAITAGAALAFSARSYARIVGANDRINMAIAGLNG